MTNKSRQAYSNYFQNGNCHAETDVWIDSSFWNLKPKPIPEKPVVAPIDETTGKPNWKALHDMQKAWQKQKKAIELFNASLEIRKANYIEQRNNYIQNKRNNRVNNLRMQKTAEARLKAIEAKEDHFNSIADSMHVEPKKPKNRSTVKKMFGGHKKEIKKHIKRGNVTIEM